MEDNCEVFLKKINNPLFFKLMLWFKLPLVAFTGVSILKMNKELCELEIKYKWLNKNPFNTIYWAVMGMAAELCSGLLVMMNAYHKKPGISMYVVACEGKFVKTGLGKITFICKDGQLIENTVKDCIATQSSSIIDCKTIAINEKSELIAEFVFKWSIKGK